MRLNLDTRTIEMDCQPPIVVANLSSGLTNKAAGEIGVKFACAEEMWQVLRKMAGSSHLEDVRDNRQEIIRLLSTMDGLFKVASRYNG